MRTIRHSNKCISILFAMLAVNYFGQMTAILAGMEPATTQSLPDVDQLIKQLGSDDADDRDAAQNHLVEIGSPAIPALKKAAENNDDPEIRSRAAAAIGQMKDHDENDASSITLHKKNTRPGEVLDELGRQSRTHFMGMQPGMMFGNGEQTLSIDADRKPFWDVMNDVCTQLNVCPVLDNPGRGYMRLYSPPRNWMVAQHQIVGPYWIGIASIYHHRTIDLMGPPVLDDQFSIRMVVCAEPKLAVAQMSDFVVKKAVDDAGNSLMPTLAVANPQPGMRGGRALNHMVEARLSFPANPGKKIAQLSGEVALLLAKDVQQFQVDNVLGGSPKITNPLKNVTVQTSVNRLGADMFRVTIQCTRHGLRDDQWNAMVNRMSDVTLEDAQGNFLSPTAAALNGQATESSFTAFAIFTQLTAGVAANRQPNRVGEASRLTWNVATSLKSETVPVTFKDLPMP